MINISEVNTKVGQVKLITITNEEGMKIVFTSFGAAIYNLSINDKLLSAQEDELDAFLTSGRFHGKTIGRTCGRIKNGKIKINEKTYSISKYWKHSLHGGKLGFAFRFFDFEIKEENEYIQLIFKYLAKDKEEGYPGNLTLNSIYNIYRKENKIDIIFDAISDCDTVCNLTNHTYFNLNVDECFLNQKMLINADQYVEIDKELIFKKYQNVDEFFDFRKIKPFMDSNVKYKKNSFYDHDFVLNGTKPNAILTSSDGKIRLEIDTTYPILHIYTGTLEADTKILGVAIECEKKAFDKDDILLKKDERYYQKSTYKFIVEGD